MTPVWPSVLPLGHPCTAKSVFPDNHQQILLKTPRMTGITHIRLVGKVEKCSLPSSLVFKRFCFEFQLTVSPNGSACCRGTFSIFIEIYIFHLNLHTKRLLVSTHLWWNFLRYTGLIAFFFAISVSHAHYVSAGGSMLTLVGVRCFPWKLAIVTRSV